MRFPSGYKFCKSGGQQICSYVLAYVATPKSNKCPLFIGTMKLIYCTGSHLSPGLINTSRAALVQYRVCMIMRTTMANFNSFYLIHLGFTSIACYVGDTCNSTRLIFKQEVLWAEDTMSILIVTPTLYSYNRNSTCMHTLHSTWRDTYVYVQVCSLLTWTQYIYTGFTLSCYLHVCREICLHYLVYMISWHSSIRRL